MAITYNNFILFYPCNYVDVPMKSNSEHSCFSGVLLLNACLTVVASQANSHKDKVL